MTSSISVASVAADSNVLLSAISGHAARRVFAEAPHVRVVTTAMNLAEVYEYLPRMAAKYKLPVRDLERATIALPVEILPADVYQDSLLEAKRYLQQRDPEDVELAALALQLRIPIWSNDRDFEELPIPIYPTARFLKALGL